jgi:hypothetical protein
MLKSVKIAALGAAAVLGSAVSADASAISFNFTNTSSGMASTDVAGVAGARVGNWNNVGVGSTSTAVVLSTVINSAGSTVAGASMTFTPPGAGALPGAASATNDARMFSNFYDQFGGTASQVQVTNIPYAQYDVVFYRFGTETNATGRGGQFTIGSENRFIRGGLANPAADGTGYVESTATVNAAGATQQGNYVRFYGLTSPTLNASFTGAPITDTVIRNKVVGFQIVEVPEPGTLGVAGLAAAGLLARRRRGS